MKKVLGFVVVMMLCAGISVAGIEFSGVMEVAYDSDIRLYTPEDSSFLITSKLSDKTAGELCWKNNALDSYKVQYKAGDGVFFEGGLLGVQFGEYYTHLVSDPMFKDSFDLTAAGIACQVSLGSSTVALGLYNNTAATRADALSFKLSNQIADGITVGAALLNDGNAASAYNVFSELSIDKYVFDNELAFKDSDSYLSCGLACQLSDTTEIAARFERNMVEKSEYTVMAGGINYQFDSALTGMLEVHSAAQENDRNNNILSKIALAF